MKKRTYGQFKRYLNRLEKERREREIRKKNYKRFRSRRCARELARANMRRAGKEKTLKFSAVWRQWI